MHTDVGEKEEKQLLSKANNKAFEKLAQIGKGIAKPKIEKKSEKTKIILN